MSKELLEVVVVVDMLACEVLVQLVLNGGLKAGAVEPTELVDAMGGVVEELVAVVVVEGDDVVDGGAEEGVGLISDLAA